MTADQIRDADRIRDILHQIKEWMETGIPTSVGKEGKWYWVCPRHTVDLFNTNRESPVAYKEMKEWCVSMFSSGTYKFNKPEWKFFFEIESDRTAFMVRWCT